MSKLLAHPLVDIVVKGEGEELAVEIAEHFQAKRELRLLKGIDYKDYSAKVVITGDRKASPLSEVTHLPYELLPMEKYLASKIDFG